MATLEARLIAVIQRIRDQFNTIRPRLMQGGGLPGQVLTKASSSDYDSVWIDLPQDESELVSADKYYFASNSLELPSQNLNPISVTNTLYRYNRWRISIGSWTARKARFLISNVLVSANTVTANSSPITFEGLFIEINGVITPITVGGAQEFTVASGAQIWTDPLSVDIPPGASLFLRSARRFVQGQTWTGTAALISPQIGDVAQHSSSSLFSVASGAVASQFPQAYSPRPPICAMVAKGHSGGPVALVIGSSGSFGTGWNTSLSDDRREVGYIRRGLGSVSGGRMTSMVLATSSGTFNNTIGTLLPWLKQAVVTLGDVPFNYVHCQLGLNDLSTLTVMQNHITNLRNYLNTNFGTLPFVMQTLTPATSGANANRWTDEAGQNYSTAAFGPDPSSRSQFNAWIKTNPSGMIAFDIASAIEGVTTSKIKVPTFTTTLASAASAGATSIVLNHAPEIGTMLVLEPGTANYDFGIDNDRLTVASVSGTGPYTVTLIGGDYTTTGDAELSKAHAAGAVVVSSNSHDGLHFTTRAQIEMTDKFVSMKGLIRSAVASPASQITQAQVQDLDSRFADVEGKVVPTGGLTGQVLSKTSATDNAVQWTNQSGVTMPEVEAAKLKGFGGFFSGKPAAGQIVGASLVQGGYLLSNSSCDFSVVTSATSSTVFTIKRNRTTDIGTVTFSAGANYGVWNLTSLLMGDNDFITIHAPATPDATLADGAFVVRAA